MKAGIRESTFEELANGRNWRVSVFNHSSCCIRSVGRSSNGIHGAIVPWIRLVNSRPAMASRAEEMGLSRLCDITCGAPY